MKILLMFIDMLRPNLLNLYSHDYKVTNFDSMLKEIGGEFYSNSYSPGPDTPRASACLWSSLYPKFNGCNTRIKYPYFFLNSNNNFLNILKDNEYDFNFYINERTKKTGLIPSGFDDYATFSNNMLLEEYLNSISISNNSLNFIYLPDYHHAVDSYNATFKSHLIGIEYINESLNLIDKIISINTFDLVILFSDHGFKLNNEKNNTLIDKIGNNRAQILLFLHTKLHKNFSVNNRLSSIMDIGPTIIDFCGLKYNYAHNGNSLFSNNDCKYLLIEDHKNFNVTLDQTIEYYSIKTSDNTIVFDCHLNHESFKPISELELSDYKHFLDENGSFFKQNIMQQKILDYYKEEQSLNNQYFNGDNVIKHFSFLKYIKCFLKKLLIKFGVINI